MHAFLSNLANRQTNKKTQAKTFTSSFVGGNYERVLISCDRKAGLSGELSVFTQL